MATSETQYDPKVTLTLDIEEAFYLKIILQNSMLSNEQEKEQALRRSIFRALPDFQFLESLTRKPHG